jgi:hypothetical protein
MIRTVRCGPRRAEADRAVLAGLREANATLAKGKVDAADALATVEAETGHGLVPSFRFVEVGLEFDGFPLGEFGFLACFGIRVEIATHVGFDRLEPWVGG